jgi:2OG-Fe(II) oxygenase superfamily
MEEFQEFHKNIMEGPQLLRYNTTAAYKPHFDYMADLTGRRMFNFDSEGTGSNRFATILFYLNDVEEGGETVFTKATETPDHIKEEMIQELRASETGLKHGSWEENMTATCRSGFVVKPKQNRAVLFYNQVNKLDLVV